MPPKPTIGSVTPWPEAEHSAWKARLKQLVARKREEARQMGLPDPFPQAPETPPKPEPEANDDDW